MAVPFFDLKPLHDELKPELQAAFDRTLETSHLIMGPELEAFEAEFAALHGAKHCIGVGNGLEALKLILLALGIGPGDEVIVPAHTFIATWLAVSEIGAIPVGVDIDLATYNIDPGLIEAAITPKTRAIMPVHLYGRLADMAPITAIAKKHKLFVIEDAAQAVIACDNAGNRAGSFGDAAGFSFYPAKNLGALGDGGAVVTNDDRIADKIKLLRNYGSRQKYQHEIAGYNSRLDELQAALMRVKLPSLARDTQRRVALVQNYFKAFADLPGLELPTETGTENAVWHLFVIRVTNRAALMDHLTARGIASLIHYPVPPHLQPAYKALDLAPGSFPKSEQAASEVLSLPLWPAMSETQQAEIITAIREWHLRSIAA